MNSIELKQNQIVRKGKYPAPNVTGYNSLFFHPLTKHGSKSELKEWGYELTVKCEQEKVQYYYFYNDHKEKINVYPNDTIMEWWENR